MKVVTLGELMLRLQPYDYLRFVQADSFEATYGGGEANVCVSLANYGIEASFVSKLPKHEIGQAALNSLRKYGVDTSNIVRGGDRLGVYYIEKGASQRPSKVIYDRANSAFALSTKEEYNWDKIFDHADWFHFTGITPALSDSCAELTLEACKEAKKRGVTISCDLNYRNKLWSREKANKVMGNLMQYVDVFFGNEDDANEEKLTAIFGGDDWEIPNMLYSPEAIFSNSVAALDVNFLNPNTYTAVQEGDGATKAARSSADFLKETISSWYVGFRNIAIVALLT